MVHPGPDKAIADSSEYWMLAVGCEQQAASAAHLSIHCNREKY